MQKYFKYQKAKVGFVWQEIHEKSYLTQDGWFIFSKSFTSTKAVDSFKSGVNSALNLSEISASEYESAKNASAEYQIEVENLKNAKENAMYLLNVAFEEAVLKVSQENVPTAEMLTWEAQERESKAYLASEPRDAMLCPTMQGIATSRGVALEELCKKCVEKSTLFRAVSASLIGQRQKYLDSIENASSVESLEALNFSFSLEVENA